MNFESMIMTHEMRFGTLYSYPPECFAFRGFPVCFTVGMMFTPSVVLSLIISLLATIYPAWRASLYPTSRGLALLSEAVLRCQNVHKRFKEGGLSVDVLSGVDLNITAGEQVAIVGQLGSGGVR
ncbi:hypothetical protein BGS_0960 [Beggiatoa sp. SS]|nr:hypothetical protein BGS_0960 [Beggiatoa sp. SS]